jgi:ABC-2 type transport system ATP-binding protein
MESDSPACQNPLVPQASSPTCSKATVATLADAHVRLGTRAVLQGADLALNEGEILALLGRNGSGKTTLIRVLTGQVRLAAGQVKVFGKDPSRETEHRRMMALVPQDIALYPRLTVRENLEIMGGMAGLPRREIPQRVEQAMAQTWIEERQHDLIEHLSGGYKRRANIAAALLTRPRLLLLDEPTVGVDVEARLSLHRTLRDLRDQGTAILLTTHDLDEARTLSDRVGILASGRLVEEGPIGMILCRMFGDRREILVTLGRDPDELIQGVLRRLGLASTSNPLEWTSWSTNLDDLSRLQANLRRHGISLHEIRLREPSLEHVLSQAEGGQL